MILRFSSSEVFLRSSVEVLDGKLDKVGLVEVDSAYVDATAVAFGHIVPISSVVVRVMMNFLILLIFSPLIVGMKQAR